MSSSSRLLPMALGPLEATSVLTSSSCSYTSTSILRPYTPRGRRTRRVLYPASQSRRPTLREAPDQALRWLLLLSAVVFLQIYSEEGHTCTDLQSSVQSAAPQECEGSLGTVQGLAGRSPGGCTLWVGLQRLSLNVWWHDRGSMLC